MPIEEGSVEELIAQSTNGSSRAFKENGAYNRDYKLSQEQIKLAALLEIDEDPQKAAKKCYINGVSFRHNNEKLDPQTIVDMDGGELFEGMIGLDSALAATKSGKPAFFAIEDEGHYVTVALVPNEDNPPKISLQYLNSITHPDPSLFEQLEKCDKKLAAIPDSIKVKADEYRRKTAIFYSMPKGEEKENLDKELSASLTRSEKQKIEDLDKLLAERENVEALIADETRMANVGKDVASTLLVHLKNKNISLSNNVVLDKSVDQQIGNCCGLSVASNIAAITKASAFKKEPELFKPKDSAEKMKHYSDFGTRIFQYIKKIGAPLAEALKFQKADAEAQRKGSEAWQKFYKALYKMNPEKSLSLKEWHEWYENSKSTIDLEAQGTNKELLEKAFAIKAPVKEYTPKIEARSEKPTTSTDHELQAALVKSKAEKPTPLSDSKVVNAEDWSKSVAAIEAVYAAKTKPLAEVVATTIIENHDMFKDKAVIKRDEFLKVISESQSLDKVDRKSLEQVARKMNDNAYSKEEMTKLISSSSFVKHQVEVQAQLQSYLKPGSAYLSPSPTPKVATGNNRDYKSR